MSRGEGSLEIFEIRRCGNWWNKIDGPIVDVGESTLTLIGDCRKN
jgi:hypothetical protein